MKKSFLLFLTLLLTILTASAFDIKVDDIYYNITGSSTVEVTYCYLGPNGYDPNSYIGSLDIPSSIVYNGNTYRVTAIGDHACYNCPNLTSVNIPSSVTRIKTKAFYYTDLNMVTLPNSVTTIDAEAFAFCPSLNRVVLGSGLTYIGERAFMGCDYLEFVGCLATTPPTMAASDVFDDDTYNNESLAVPKGSMSAYQAANWWKNFSNVEELFYDFYVNGIYYTITGSNTVEVATGATDSYSGEVIIPSSVTYGGKTYQVTGIGVVAFAACQHLTAVSIPLTVTYIGESAFEQSMGLTSIEIPNSVTTIARRAFYKCADLTSVTIGSEVTSIGSKAFWHCDALRSVTCRSITPPVMDQDDAFTYDTYEEGTLTVPKGSRNAYSNANWWKNFNTIQETDYSFLVNDIYYNVTGSNTVEVTYKDAGYRTYSGNVTVPSSVPYGGKTYNVTRIGVRAFSSCPDLFSVTVPNSVTSIGDYAFYHSQFLTSVNLPHTVTTLGNYAFYNCSALKSIVLPYSLTSIGNRTFYHCSKLTEVTIGASVTSIGTYAFNNCTALTTVICRAQTPPTMAAENVFGASIYSNAKLYVPNASYHDYLNADWWKNFSTKGLRDYDFLVDGIYYSITGIDTVEVSHNWDVKYSGTVSIPRSVSYNGNSYQVTGIGSYAFTTCPNLTGVTIPSSVTTISGYAFWHCSGLTSLSIPSSVTSLGEAAFAYCTALTSMTIPNGVTAIRASMCSGCTSLTSVSIPNTVTSIDAAAFMGCSNLLSVSIPNLVSSIGEFAFNGCQALTSVTLPASLTSLGFWAFEECPNLMSVTCLATTPPTPPMPTDNFYSNMFATETYNNGILFVPKSSLNVYQNSLHWEYFTNIQPTLDYALNTVGGTAEFVSTGNYPWTNVVDGGRVYAISGNKGCHSSTSTMTTTVTLVSAGSVTFDFKAWGEGSNYDVCVFTVDGVQQFRYGARKNNWETFTVELSSGTHTLSWDYIKDYSVNPEGDYFAVDNVIFTGLQSDVTLGDVDGDGRITIGDVSELIDRLLGGMVSIDNCPAADVDGDGRLTIGDVSDLIDHLLSGN